MKRRWPHKAGTSPTLKEVPDPAAPRELLATGWYHKTTKTLIVWRKQAMTGKLSRWQELTCPCRYGGISSCPALPSQDFSLPHKELDFCCYIPQGHLEDVKHCFSFKEKYFLPSRKRKRNTEKHKNMINVHSCTWNPRKQKQLHYICCCLLSSPNT